ncbi:hypothetical protein PSN45_000405 [Yamadazyma tenuis]|uniref:Major facilitator superfamily (MFS) profile domain-containing protein n=1 Tax=Candida tenuis (strain ATCC 10573 / BCRC 21748 / CBS 615 / JCM 9827 / NBRC 10315 / NRRL Y-1498 / VKM Y-70) TaxID=590646 RepID=G3B889_CANTC|nr:uncharacterized protein CANTEDRAFT_124738 [Yamadazyma tenuis ATCC 10573]EGV61714.1 hypothetical protein CANTEDRAFT_124738 [Yamadazyma tenuis ATCC 10573]WEJ92947.1 hypothetical protein PSN45_000405 [Yamadazyma tenuis]
MDEKVEVAVSVSSDNKKLKDEGIQVADTLANSHENTLSKQKLLVVFSAMSVSLFLSFVDQTAITVALPYIAEELDAENTISWAGTASLISTTMFMVLFGRFSDIFSRKYVLIGCLLVLAVFDLACGFAQTPYQLFIFRGFCGIGNGGVTSLTMVIVSDIVTLKERGKYQGILGSFVGLGNALGPILASAFISHLSWRKFYYMMFPIGILAAAIIFWLVPFTRPQMTLKEKLAKIDYLGFFFSSVAIIFILIPVSGGGTYYSWSSPLVISFLVIGGVSGMMFFFVEKKIAFLPMIPLNLFSTRMSLTCLLLQNFFFGMCYFGHVYYYPYFFQIVRRYSAIKASVHLLALVLPQSTTSVICGQVISRTGHYIYVVWYGYIAWTLGVCLLCLWGPDANQAKIIIPLILNGSGVGAIFQPTLVAAQAQSFKRDRATVISARNVLRSFGGAVGLAVASTIIANSFSKHLSLGGDLFTSSEIIGLKSQVYSSLSLDSYSKDQSEFLIEAYMSSLKNVFYFWMGSISLCLVSNVVVRDRGLEPLDEQSAEHKTL